MFVLCVDRTRDLLRSRRVLLPLRQISRQISMKSMEDDRKKSCFLLLFRLSLLSGNKVILFHSQFLMISLWLVLRESTIFKTSFTALRNPWKKETGRAAILFFWLFPLSLFVMMCVEVSVNFWKHRSLLYEIHERKRQGEVLFSSSVSFHSPVRNDLTMTFNKVSANFQTIVYRFTKSMKERDRERCYSPPLSFQSPCS
jgi:hypothetical protein